MFNSFPLPKPDSGGNFIKSIQRGETSNNSGVASFTATISPVDITKSVIMCSTESGSSTANNGMLVRASFTNSTTITFNKGAAVPGNPTVQWQVIEFTGAKSVQFGSTVVAGLTLGVAINAVNTAKSWVLFSFATTQSATTLTGAVAGAFLTNSTTLTLNNAGGNTTFDWFVVEF